MDSPAYDTFKHKYRAYGMNVVMCTPAFPAVHTAGFRPAAPLADRRKQTGQFFGTPATNKVTDFPAT